MNHYLCMFMVVNRSREEWKTYANVFDKFTLRNLDKLSGQGYFVELASAIDLGKEANVFSAITKDESHVAVKIYRLENCNFNKMYEYISQDPRYADAKGDKRRIIFAWNQREYRNLLKAREFIRVPTPLTFKDNIVVMEFIDEEGKAAPKLKDVHLEDPEEFFYEVYDAIKKLLIDANLVHGDLSEFNILVQNGSPVFIDFSQGTAADAPNAAELLRRDIQVICTFFKKRGFTKDPQEMYDELAKMKNASN
jgi:RIO kinase 1